MEKIIEWKYLLTLLATTESRKPNGVVIKRFYIFGFKIADYTIIKS